MTRRSPGRITLRNVRREDLPHILSWWSNPLIRKVQRVERFEPTLADVEEQFTSCWVTNSPEKYVLLIIELDGEPVGEVGYRYQHGSVDTMQVDIKIGRPELWRQGIGTQAMRQLVQLLFEKHPVSALLAEVGLWNTASQRLFSNCGFVEVARQYSPSTTIFDGGSSLIMRLERSQQSA